MRAIKSEQDILDRIMALPVLHLLQPFYIKNKELILYIFFGALTTLISILTYALLTEVMGMDILAANIISWVLAVLFAFVTNRRWVFSSGREGKWLPQMFSFYSGRLATLGIEELILWLFIERMNLPNMPVKICAQIIVIVLNYIISKVIIFKKNK